MVPFREFRHREVRETWVLKTRRRLGLRGAGMLLIAFVWFLIGLGDIRDLSATPNSAWHLLIPSEIRGTVWIFSAALCLILAWTKSQDWIALVVACIMPTIRITSYTWAWIMSLIPGPPDGFPGGWYSSAIHFALLGLVMLVAAIREIPRTLDKEVHTDE